MPPGPSGGPGRGGGIIGAPNAHPRPRSRPLDDRPSDGAPFAGAAGDPTGSREPGPSGAPPGGLRHEIGATVASLRRLVAAHVELARAELGEIVGEVRRVAILVGLAAGALLVGAVLLPVGGLLFLGEWLFGSIGWGVLLGTELTIGLAVALVLAALGVPASRLATHVLIAAGVAVAVGLVLGLDLTNRGWSALADRVALGIVPEWRVLVTAVVGAGLVLGAILGLAGAVRGGLGGLVGGFVGGAVGGGILGALTAPAFGPQVGAALGVAAGLLVWPIVSGAAAFRAGIDLDTLKARFWPDVTIDTTKETLEWLRQRAPIARR